MAYGSYRLRPLGVGDLLDEMVRLYRRHFALFIGIAAWVFVPLGIVQLLQLFLMRGLRSPVLAGIIALMPAPVMWIGGMAMGLAMTYAVSELQLGRHPSVADSYLGGYRRFWGTLGLSILIGLALILLSITILGIPVAIYFGVCWAVSIPVLLLEGVGIRRAMGRSRALVKGNWWRVLGIAILVGVIQFVIAFFFSFVGGLVGAFFAGDFVAIIANTLGEMVGTPLMYSALVLIYYDLRVRKEGFDLELLAQAVEGIGPAGDRPQAVLG